jgi:hypothetical protein
MARFKRAYPGRPYIHKGPGPAAPSAGTLAQAAPAIRTRRPPARARIGPLGAINNGDGIAIKSPPVSVLTDSLHSVTENTSFWNPAFNLGVPVFTTSGVSVTTSTVSAQYSSIETRGTYNLTGGFLSHRLVNPGNQALVSLEIVMAELVDIKYNNKLGFYLNNGSLSAFYRISGTNHFAGTVTFSAAVHVWFRVRESLGTTFWETSPDGLNWSAFFSIVNQFSVTDLYVVGVDVGTFNVEATSTTVVVDDINVAGSVTPVASRPKPFVFRSPLPLRARARVGNNGQLGDGVASQVVTPRGSLLAQRPFVARNPLPARARTGNSGTCGDGFAGPQPTAAVVAARVVARPFVFRSPPRARARVGNAASIGDGAGYPAIYPPGGATGSYGLPRPVTFPISFRPFTATPQPYQRTAPQIRRPRPQLAQVGPQARAVGGGRAGVQTPLGSPSRPRPFVFRSPAPARARVGPRQAPAAGVTSQVVTPRGTLPAPALRPVIVHLPPHRAKVGPGTFIAAGRAGVLTPLGFQSQPPPRPVFVHVPPARARLGLRGQAAGGVASAVVTPLGSPSQPAPRPVIQHVPPRRAVWRGLAVPAAVTAAVASRPRPFVFRPSLPARARVGNSFTVGDGFAGPPNPVVTAYQRIAPQIRRPAPARGRLGPRSAVAGGIASQVVTPRGTLPAPRKVQIFPPKITRARVGHGTVAGGVVSAAITPVAPIPVTAYQQPAPQVKRPAPSRALIGHGGTGGGVASQVVTPRGFPQPTVSIVVGQRRTGRAVVGPKSGLAGGNAVPAVVVPVVPVTAYQRPAPQVKRPAPARAWIGRGGIAGGVASQVVTPRGSLPPPRKVLHFPPKITRAVVGPGAVAGGFASKVITPVVVPFPAPYGVSIVIGQRKIGRAVTGPASRPAGGIAYIPPPLGSVQPTLPVVEFRPPPPPRGFFGPRRVIGPQPAAPVTAYQRIAPQIRRPSPARARIGPRGLAGAGVAAQAVVQLGSLPPLHQPLPQIKRSIPARGKLGPRGTVAGGVTAAGPIPAPQAYQRPAPYIKRPGPARGRLGPRGLAAGGIASRVIASLGVVPPPRKVQLFPPKTTRARVGHGTVAGGVTGPLPIPAPQARQRPAPQVKRPAPARARIGPQGLVAGGIASRVANQLGSVGKSHPFVFRGLARTRARIGPAGATGSGAAGPQPIVAVLLGIPQYAISIIIGQRKIYRAVTGPRSGLAGGIYGTANPLPQLGTVQPTRPIVEFRPPPPPRGFTGPHRVIGLVNPSPPPPGTGTAPPTIPVVEFRPPPPPRGYFGPHRVIGLVNPPPPVPPVIVPGVTGTAAAQNLAGSAAAQDLTGTATAQNITGTATKG